MFIIFLYFLLYPKIHMDSSICTLCRAKWGWKFFSLKIVWNNKLWKKGHFFVSKTFRKVVFPNKIWGSTEKKTIFLTKKSTKKHFLTISAKKNNDDEKNAQKAHVLFKRKKHTSRRVASTRFAVLSRGEGGVVPQSHPQGRVHPGTKTRERTWVWGLDRKDMRPGTRERTETWVPSPPVDEHTRVKTLPYLILRMRAVNISLVTLSILPITYVLRGKVMFSVIGVNCPQGGARHYYRPHPKDEGR